MTAYADNQIINGYASKEFLVHVGPQVAIRRYLKKFTQPRNNSDTIYIPRFVPFAVDATTTLTEGVTPAAGNVDIETVTATLQQFGDLRKINDKAIDMSDWGKQLISGGTKLQAEWVANTQEQLAWNVAKAGSSVLYDTSAHTLRTQVDSPITSGRLDRAVRTLRANGATEISEGNMAGAGEGTVPTEPAFYAFCHVDLEPDIRNLAGFTPCNEYGDGSKVEYEFGQVGRVKFITTRRLGSFAGGGAASTTMINTSSVADVYPIVICGAEALGCVVLAGRKSAETFVLDKADKSDGLNQRVLLGTKYYDQCLRLNENFLIRIEVAATLNP